MRTSLALIALSVVACSTPTPTPVVPEMCVEPVATQVYDIPNEPTGFEMVDPVMGLSAEQIEATVFGESTGTLSPSNSEDLGVAMLFGVDGVVEVRDFGPDCPPEWEAEMFVVMSSDALGEGFAVDDIWTVTAIANSTTEARASGTKSADDFDGTLTAIGNVTFDAVLSGDSWTGSITDDNGTIATFSTESIDSL